MEVSKVSIDMEGKSILQEKRIKKIISPDFSGVSFEDSKKLIPYILKVDTAIEVHTFPAPLP